jgi:hypothetical protein
MRYSRFKQQMEGHSPVRRAPRNPNVKRTPKAKRTKSEDKKIKSEESPSSLNTSRMDSSVLQSNTPIANPDASQESLPNMTPEAVMVKSEPRENTMEEMLESMTPISYGLESPISSMQHMTHPESMVPPHSHPRLHLDTQQHQHQHQRPSPPHPTSASTAHENSYPFSPSSNVRYHSQLQHQHQQPRFQPLEPHHQSLESQSHMLVSSADLNHEMTMASSAHRDPCANRDFEYLNMDLFPIEGMGCQQQMMGPAVKVEERWDPSYCQA